jgi:hypothetical protein
MKTRKPIPLDKVMSAKAPAQRRGCIERQKCGGGYRIVRKAASY